MSDETYGQTQGRKLRDKGSAEAGLALRHNTQSPGDNWNDWSSFMAQPNFFAPVVALGQNIDPQVGNLLNNFSQAYATDQARKRGLLQDTTRAEMNKRGILESEAGLGLEQNALANFDATSGIGFAQQTLPVGLALAETLNSNTQNQKNREQQTSLQGLVGTQAQDLARLQQQLQLDLAQKMIPIQQAAYEAAVKKHRELFSEQNQAAEVGSLMNRLSMQQAFQPGGGGGGFGPGGLEQASKEFNNFFQPGRDADAQKALDAQRWNMSGYGQSTYNGPIIFSGYGAADPFTDPEVGYVPGVAGGGYR